MCGQGLRGSAIAACLSLAACAGTEPARQSPGAAADPAALYERACARCHGADGSGGLPMAPDGPRPIDFRSQDWQASRTDGEIASAIRDGRGAMPPFSDVLAADDVAALTRRVRQFAQPSAPASSHD